MSSGTDRVIRWEEKEGENLKVQFAGILLSEAGRARLWTQ